MKSISPILGCSCALWGAIIAALNWQLGLVAMFIAMAAILLATAYRVGAREERLRVEISRQFDDWARRENSYLHSRKETA